MAHETAHKKMPTRPVLLVMQWNEWAARAGVEVPRPPADLQGRPRKQDERHTARTPPLSGGGGWVLAVGQGWGCTHPAADELHVEREGDAALGFIDHVLPGTQPRDLDPRHLLFGATTRGDWGRHVVG